MKKRICILMLALCMLMALAAPVAAKEDALAVKFQDALDLLDHLYEYGPQYMVKVANDAFVSYDDEEWFKTVSAAEYEAVLHKHFVIDDAMLQSIRTYDEGLLEYNAADNTYTIYMGGGFGGILPAREYAGYVKNGNTYDVYYVAMQYEFLEDLLPEGTTIEDIIGDDWSSTVVYGGITYQDGPGGYYRVLGRENYGKKYTVELNGDVVRIISCTEYSGTPAGFDDGSGGVEYETPQDNSVTIPDNTCFEADTTVKVEQITAGETMQTVTQAMAPVAEKYVAYEFTATKNNTAVQPNGKLAVTFAIPAQYSDNVAVYYMAKSGELEKLNATVNGQARTVTVELEHFSTYILVDESTAHVHSYGDLSVVVTPPTEDAPGEGKKTCTVCGHSETFPIEYTPVPGPITPGDSTDTETPKDNTNGEQDGKTDEDDGNGQTPPDYTMIIIVAGAVVLLVAAVAVPVILKRREKA